MKILLKVRRFDPDCDRGSRLADYEVEIPGSMKVLDALQKARDTDPSLSFRRSCRSAICGSCAVSINGVPSLACHVRVKDVARLDGSLLIEPLPHFRVLRDLVVDLGPFFESLHAVLPFHFPKTGRDGLMTQADSALIESPANCILCGACNAAMEPPGEVSPVALVKGLRHALDSRDRLGCARMALMNVPEEVLRLFLSELPEKCVKGINISVRAAIGAGETAGLY